MRARVHSPDRWPRECSFRWGPLLFLIALAPIVSVAAGCVPPAALEQAQKQADDAAKERAENEKKGSIIGKTTQEIGKYDPAAGRQPDDLKVRATSPVFYALEAYGPITGQISTLAIDQAVTIFEIQNGHYPTYEEFMRDIIKGQNIRLPVLPAKAEYQYDEANHKLVVLAYEEPGEKKDGVEAPENEEK